MHNNLAQDSTSRPRAIIHSSAPAMHDMKAAIAARLDELPDVVMRNIFLEIEGRQKRHALDFRVSFRFPFWSRFYVNITAGREQRNRNRLNEEGLTSSTRRAAFYGAIVFALIGYCLFGFFCFLYLLKSAFNINIFSGQSPFHPIYALFFA